MQYMQEQLVVSEQYMQYIQYMQYMQYIQYIAVGEKSLNVCKGDRMSELLKNSHDCDYRLTIIIIIIIITL